MGFASVGYSTRRGGILATWPIRRNVSKLALSHWSARGPRNVMSIFDRFKLTGKQLFITGGSRGLGREMAVAIADAGADVILVGRDPAGLEEAAGDIRALGRQCWTLASDVGKPAECEQACRLALAQHGPIDTHINNVGAR